MTGILEREPSNKNFKPIDGYASYADGQFRCPYCGKLFLEASADFVVQGLGTTKCRCKRLIGIGKVKSSE